MGRKYNGVDFPSSLRKWELIEAFENLKECKAAREERYSKNLSGLSGDELMIAIRTRYFACVVGDDPRMK
jgi:hypothetical protein